MTKHHHIINEIESLLPEALALDSRSARKKLSHVKHLNRKDKPKHENVFYIDKSQDDVQVELALRYIEEYTETVMAFTP